MEAGVAAAAAAGQQGHASTGSRRRRRRAWERRRERLRALRDQPDLDAGSDEEAAPSEGLADSALELQLVEPAEPTLEAESGPMVRARRPRRRRASVEPLAEPVAEVEGAAEIPVPLVEPAPKRRARPKAPIAASAPVVEVDVPLPVEVAPAPKPRRTRAKSAASQPAAVSNDTPPQPTLAEPLSVAETLPLRRARAKPAPELANGVTANSAPPPAAKTGARRATRQSPTAGS